MVNNKLSDEQPKKFFEIHQGDVGTTAFEDRYVHWLESQLATVTAERDELSGKINVTYAWVEENLNSDFTRGWRKALLMLLDTQQEANDE